LSDNERERWNARYREASANLTPSPFLAVIADRLPVSGRALDVAGGWGRNARWLAQRGFEVTIADISDVGLARAAALGVRTVQLDLEAEPLPQGPWDLILVSHYLHRPLFAQFPSLLAAGGLLVVAHPTVTNLQRNPKPDRQFLLADGELGRLAAGLEVLFYEEAWFDGDWYEARLLAQKL
jgi:tellurite methyltransferase